MKSLVDRILEANKRVEEENRKMAEAEAEDERKLREERKEFGTKFLAFCKEMFPDNVIKGPEWGSLRGLGKHVLYAILEIGNNSGYWYLIPMGHPRYIQIYVDKNGTGLKSIGHVEYQRDVEGVVESYVRS